jgi:hypothetical protein
MMVRFSPASEFSPVAPTSSGDMKRSSSVSKRFLIPARSAFESGEVTQTLRDILALLAGALLIAALCGSIIFSVFILARG